MRVGLSTLGCRLNQAESDGLHAELSDGGHEIVADASAAEVWIVNTCTITHRADADARRLVRRLGRANPGLKVVVTGCWAEADPGAAAALPQTAIVVGNAEKDRLLEHLDRLGDVPRTDAFVAVSALRRRVAPRVVAAAPPGRSRPFLKVQDGCNYRCAFCVVPHVRGNSRSVDIDGVRRALGQLLAQGVGEVVLTGAHLGTWGRDLRPRVRLAELVAALLPELGAARLRLSSIDPHEVGDDLIAIMAENPDRICRHLHLPVQSGDDAILRAMRRGHTVEDFATLGGELAARVPGIAIGTDIVVGFPGEDDAAFDRTAALLAALPLAYHHVFAYSRRTGTTAATMPGQVSQPTKAERSRQLRRLSREQAARFGAQFRGQSLDAIVERRRDGGRLVAITDNFLRLPFVGSERWVRQRLCVRIDSLGQARAASSDSRGTSGRT